MVTGSKEEWKALRNSGRVVRRAAASALCDVRDAARPFLNHVHSIKVNSMGKVLSREIGTV